ncbi:putative 40S ribosomal protein S9, mitochondrial [Toxocara canis]|uniref:Putative 40S ribosomal protein S9, mitochondrial n=1 Tax=Toxocara canis TaxID=6265 RepID=A0A0B2UUK3_TOXCA|nr:putative 40S ribosomal protein S9, mitochondrial [Toxocara canis]
MIAKERAQYELGKRHLANIMGIDPNSITQEDIDKAIAYLFPSGLTDPLAQPVMKPPEEIMPKFHKLTFDDEGRPVGSLFYTVKPKFYRLLSDIGIKTSRLMQYQHEQILKNAKWTPEQELVLSGSAWISKEDLAKKLEESITNEMYAQLIIAFDYLCSLPFSSMERDFIFEYRKEIASGTGNRLFGPQIPAVELVPESNRRMAHSKTSVKRTSVEVTVSDAGTGKYTVNGHGIDEFRSLQAREILLAPLLVADLLGLVDIAAEVKGPGGLSVVPRVVRHGVALGIAALYPEHADKLRLAGLLTRDPRKRERSKVNQPGARAKWIWLEEALTDERRERVSISE